MLSLSDQAFTVFAETGGSSIRPTSAGPPARRISSRWVKIPLWDVTLTECFALSMRQVYFLPAQRQHLLVGFIPMFMCIDEFVTERSDRLRRAFQESRYSAEGLSAAETAKRTGWNPNSFKSNMNGNMPFSFERAKIYAEKLKVRAEWLYDGNGPMREVSRPARLPIEVPVIGWVSAGKVADVGDLDEVDRLVAGNLPPGEYFATEVVGDSVDRVAPEGARIIVNSADRTPKDGNFYIFSHRGEPTVKRYRSKPVQRLEPFSTNPAHEPIFIKDRGWHCVGRVVRSVIDLT